MRRAAARAGRRAGSSAVPGSSSPGAPSDRSPVRGRATHPRKPAHACGTVAPMATPRSRQAARLRARRRRAQQRARRLVVLSVLAVLGVVTLLFTAFGSSGSSGPAPIAIETVSLATPRQSGRGRRCSRRSATSRSSSPSQRRGHGDRLPRVQRRIAHSEAGRPPGQRGAARAALAPHRRKRAQVAALVPARGRPRRDERARRRRPARHRRLRPRRRARSSRSATRRGRQAASAPASTFARRSRRR